ncbi:MAG TPA: dTMP kinase [Bacteroidetes bacterium]|nr:dTMP kinase [Bacteroidota bacterium]
MIISFEGIDGSGKTTQINLLKKKLEADGVDVRLFREPGGTELSEVIRGMLLNPEIEINSVTELLLFSSARSQLIAEKVEPHMGSEGVIILDRFFDSTVAYQGYGRGSVSLEQIYQLNKIASHGITPDITFYLRVDLETAEKRRSNFLKDRMERAGNDFYQKVILGFDEISKSEPRFTVIDASLEIEYIHKKILDQVTLKLKKV